jgi:uncharacterized protein YbaP (TraB family)
MRIRLGVAVALLTWALACASPPARQPAAAAPGSAPAAAGEGPLLWRAEGREGGALFLLGSVHLGTPETFTLGGAVADAWARSDELVVEIDVSGVSPEEATEITLRYGTLPPGVSLQDRVAPETWSRLSAELERLGLPPQGFAGFKPWLAATTLVVLQLQQAGLQAEYGVDRQMIGRASSKPIVGLESFASQLSMMDSLPDALQELMLVDALERAADTDAQASLLVESWQKGDEEALVEVLFGELEQHPEFEILYEKIYFERNEAMSARLAQLSRDGKTRFTVLGVGHMVGPRGIPALLASQGFRVERVR